MKTEHKRVIMIILAVIFALLLTGTTYIAIFTQNFVIAGVLVVVFVVLLVDILWKSQSKKE
jgi:hypothetical protein